MACGVPVISTPVGQTVELVENKKNGLLISNYSPNLLAEKSFELIEDKNLQSTIKIAGKQTALENDFVTSDEGKKIQVSVCPNGHGKIKSPTCCGADMDCKG